MNILQLQTILYQKAENWKVTTTAKELGVALEASPQTVKQHIKKLVADKVITKIIETPGSPNTFVLKPLAKPPKVAPDIKKDKPSKVSKKAVLRQDALGGLWWLKLSNSPRFNADDIKRTGREYVDKTDPTVPILGPFQTEEQAEDYAKQQLLELID